MVSSPCPNVQIICHVLVLYLESIVNEIDGHQIPSGRYNQPVPLPYVAPRIQPARVAAPVLAPKPVVDVLEPQIGHSSLGRGCTRQTQNTITNIPTKSNILLFQDFSEAGREFIRNLLAQPPRQVNRNKIMAPSGYPTSNTGGYS